MVNPRKFEMNFLGLTFILMFYVKLSIVIGYRNCCYFEFKFWYRLLTILHEM